MKITANQWNRALMLEKLFMSKQEKLTREILSDEFKVPEVTARHILFALENKGIISHDLPQFEVSGKRVLFWPDIHIPYQDETTVELIIEYAKKIFADMIVFAGDLIDFYQISRFMHDPKQKTVTEEIKLTKKFLERIRGEFPAAKIIYKRGNHEERLEHFILSQCPQLSGLLENLLEEKLNLAGFGIDYEIMPFSIGYLWYIHGHEVPCKNSNVEYMTNIIWKWSHDNVISGHWHREQAKLYPSIKGNRYIVQCVGHSSDPTKVDYTKYKLRNDIEGFADIEYDINGRFKIHPHRIIDGEIY